MLTEQDLKTIKNNIEDGIEELSLKLHPIEFRNHLGISEIGAPCSRQLYYKFHWTFLEQINGRMRRLFARGHREEERYINYLEGIGCKVERFDENGKQFRVSALMGHYGGSCDGRVITPWFSNKLLLECKTHNTKSFTYYVEKGLKKAKPQHYDQMCGYGYYMELEDAIYFPENKNDDDIQTEIVKLDWNRGKQLEKKAEEIIFATEPPPKISENPAFFECKYCAALHICHYDAIPLKNCRSCRMSKAIENACWHCSRFGQVIPENFIIKGCDNWVPI